MHKTIVTGAVGGAAGVIHATSAHTDCEPNANVEVLRVLMDQAQIEAVRCGNPCTSSRCIRMFCLCEWRERGVVCVNVCCRLDRMFR